VSEDVPLSETNTIHKSHSIPVGSRKGRLSPPKVAQAGQYLFCVRGVISPASLPTSIFHDVFRSLGGPSWRKVVREARVSVIPPPKPPPPGGYADANVPRLPMGYGRRSFSPQELWG